MINPNMSRVLELLEKRKNLTATIWEEEELIRLTKILPKEEHDKIDPELLTYSNGKRLDDIIKLLDALDQVIESNKNKK